MERRLARTDLGDKQVCPNCGARFYDLRKRPAICPKCTTAFDPAEEGVRARRSRGRVAAHDPALEDDEEVDAKKKKGAGDDEDEDEEVEEAAPLDSEEIEVATLDSDEEDDTKPASDDDELPEGFSEDDGEDVADADDDTVPLIDDEEEFNEDELGVPGGDDDDGNR